MVNFPIFSSIFKRIQIRGGEKPVFKTYKIQNTGGLYFEFMNLLLQVWVLKKREEQGLEAAQMKFLRQAQMKFLRHLLGVTKLDKEKNQYIRGKTGEQNIVKEIKQYREKWLQHVQRMDTDRLPKQALQYQSKGRRNIGRPRKRWRDQIHLED